MWMLNMLNEDRLINVDTGGLSFNEFGIKSFISLFLLEVSRSSAAGNATGFILLQVQT